MSEDLINSTVVSLLDKVIKEQSLTDEEQQTLNAWLDASAHNQALLEELKNEDSLFEALQQRYVFDSKGEWEKMLSKIREKNTLNQASEDKVVPHHLRDAVSVKKGFFQTNWFRYAAAVLVIVIGATIFYINQKTPSSTNYVQQNGNAIPDIQPGTNKAILKIGNQSIDLAHNKTGISVGAIITYNDGERIADAGEMLELSTPRGGRYEAVLPDGTKVWLNALSSIRFPSSFQSLNREVAIKGEVYFEVAHDAKHPFLVKADDTEIKVLGTSFNVNAYPDEEGIKTSLVTGSVSLMAGKEQAVLKPGQQAIFNYQDHLISVNNNPDEVEKALAWKNGLFNFNDADIQEMLRSIARWYDVEIVYEGTIPKRVFEGKMQMDIPLSSALRILQLNKINFRVEGRKIIVMP